MKKFAEASKVACRYKHLLFLPTYLGITYSTAKHFTFKPPPQRKTGRAQFTASGAENPSYATDYRPVVLSGIVCVCVCVCAGGDVEEVVVHDE